MPNIDPTVHKNLVSLMVGLDQEFDLWRPHYQDLAKFVLPRKYEWVSQSTTTNAMLSAAGSVATASAPTAANQHNTSILDSSGTEALNVLALGLLNGITSPARPWFRLRLAAFRDDLEDYPVEFLRWLDEVTRRLYIIFSESNFYNAAATQYIEAALFGTAPMLIYEDFDEITRFYNSPVGEFRLLQDSRQMVSGFARVFHYRVHQLIERFGQANCSPEVVNMWNAGGANRLQSIPVCHLILPNTNNDAPRVPAQFAYKELYWERAQNDGRLLSLNGFREKPFSIFRWEQTGTDTYGTSPGMMALPDIKQLQVEVRQKAQALDKMVRPPIVADVALSSRPDSLLPGGVTFAPGSGFGAKPIYTVTPPLQDMTNDIMRIQERIRRIFFNHLFRNVSDLTTVRSAEEIIQRKAEDMVILGGVLERFQNEGLDPLIRRVFNIAHRDGLLPTPPAGLDPNGLKVEFVSVLADAQRAVGTRALEQFMAVGGQMAASFPEVLDIINSDELFREYGKLLNVPAAVVRSRAEAQARAATREQQLAAQQAGLVGKDLTQAAQNLAGTQMGTGSALDALIQGAGGAGG